MSIYKRGATYWFSFTLNGQRYQESTKVRSRTDARAIEAAARTRLARGEWGIDAKPKSNPTLAELFDQLEVDFKLRGKFDAKNQSNLKCARAAFPGTTKAANLTAASIESYIERKMRQGRAPATINRHLLLVGQAFRLAKIPAPEIRHLSEAGNERRGFFEADEFARLLEHIPDDLKDFCRFAYLTGWRKAEIASLVWSDIEGDVVRLRGENSKNKEPRSVVLVGKLATIIERRRAARYVHGVLTNFVFHRGGTPVAEFRKSWARACVEAKLGAMVCPKCGEEGETQKCCACNKRRMYSGKIFHDFRRTAVRDMIRAGVPQNIAMRISGHKTTSMFKRYDVCNEADLRQAIEAVQRYHEAAQQKVVTMTAGS